MSTMQRRWIERILQLIAVLTLASVLRFHVLLESSRQNRRIIVQDEPHNTVHEESTILLPRNAIPSVLVVRQSSNQTLTRGSQTRRMSSVGKTMYMFNCSNIQQIRLDRFLGHGDAKEAFVGDFNGLKVAVKKVLMFKWKDTWKRQREDMLREIFILKQLNHPGLASLLGYCIQPLDNENETMNIVSVLELGHGDVREHAKTMAWKEKLGHAVKIAEFINYLDKSPLGTLMIYDCKTEHFLLVDDRFKLIDSDSLEGKNVSCRNGMCGFDLPYINGDCKGFSAANNLNCMHRNIFIPLLTLEGTTYPTYISKALRDLFQELDLNNITIADVQLRLQTILKSIL